VKELEDKLREETSQNLVALMDLEGKLQVKESQSSEGLMELEA